MFDGAGSIPKKSHEVCSLSGSADLRGLVHRLNCLSRHPGGDFRLFDPVLERKHGGLSPAGKSRHGLHSRTGLPGGLWLPGRVRPLTGLHTRRQHRPIKKATSVGLYRPYRLRGFVCIAGCSVFKNVVHLLDACSITYTLGKMDLSMAFSLICSSVHYLCRPGPSAEEGANPRLTFAQDRRSSTRPASKEFRGIYRNTNADLTLFRHSSCVTYPAMSTSSIWDGARNLLAYSKYTPLSRNNLKRSASRCPSFTMKLRIRTASLNFFAFL